ARLAVQVREHGIATARLQSAPQDANARLDLEALSASMNRTEAILEADISMLGRLGQDAVPLKVSLIVTTGKITSAALEPRVIGGLIQYWRHELLEFLATRAARWIFQGLLIAVIVVGFTLVAKLTRRLVRRGLARAGTTQLLRHTIEVWSFN